MEKELHRVLFICVHNSARSQMAEAFLNCLGEGRFIAESAGLEPGKLNPYVVEVMREVGYDLSKNSCDSVMDLWKQGKVYKYVISVCSKEASEGCPIFPGQSTHMNWPFEDPSSVKGDKETKLKMARTVRDQIRERIEQFIREEQG